MTNKTTPDDVIQMDHTLVHLVCHDCDEIGEMKIIDHSRETSQVHALIEIYSSIAERHADKTGHHTQLGATEGPEIDLVDLARVLSPI